jgi:hypothetical protein
MSWNDEAPTWDDNPAVRTYAAAAFAALEARLAQSGGAGLVQIEVGIGFEQAFGDMRMAPLCGTGRAPVDGASGVA